MLRMFLIRKGLSLYHLPQRHLGYRQQQKLAGMTFREK